MLMGVSQLGYHALGNEEDSRMPAAHRPGSQQRDGATMARSPTPPSGSSFSCSNSVYGRLFSVVVNVDGRRCGASQTSELPSQHPGDRPLASTRLRLFERLDRPMCLCTAEPPRAPRSGQHRLIQCHSLNAPLQPLSSASPQGWKDCTALESWLSLTVATCPSILQGSKACLEVCSS